MEADRAERAGDLGRVAEIRYGRLLSSSSELSEREAGIDRRADGQGRGR